MQKDSEKLWSIKCRIFESRCSGVGTSFIYTVSQGIILFAYPHRELNRVKCNNCMRTLCVGSLKVCFCVLCLSSSNMSSWLRASIGMDLAFTSHGLFNHSFSSAHLHISLFSMHIKQCNTRALYLHHLTVQHNSKSMQSAVVLLVSSSPSLNIDGIQLVSGYRCRCCCCCYICDGVQFIFSYRLELSHSISPSFSLWTMTMWLFWGFWLKTSSGLCNSNSLYTCKSQNNDRFGGKKSEEIDRANYMRAR